MMGTAATDARKLQTWADREAFLQAKRALALQKIQAQLDRFTSKTASMSTTATAKSDVIESKAAQGNAAAQTGLIAAQSAAMAPPAPPAPTGLLASMSAPVKIALGAVVLGGAWWYFKRRRR